MVFDSSNVESIESRRAIQLPRTQTILKAQNLGFPASHGVNFQDLNFEVSSGSVFAVEGGTVSARSLLLSICSLVEVQYEGSLLFEGVELKSLNDRDQNVLRRFLLGLVPRQATLIDVLNVQENIEYVLNSLPMTTHDRQEQTTHLLRAMGMYEHRFKRPHQLTREQRQRVAIARSLAKKPRLICLDDPTASLSSAVSEELMTTTLGLADSFASTVLIASEDPVVLVRARRALRLS